MIYSGQGVDIPSDIAFYGGLVYVTGTSDGANSGPDIYTAAYDFSRSSGSELVWDHRYDGPSHMGDGANALYVKGDYLYVTGYVHRGNKTAHADYLTIKYDRLTGKKIWDMTYDSTRNGNDKATAVIADEAGNVYVTGMSQESESKKTGPKTHDYFTVKYSSSGRILWDVRDDGPGDGTDIPSDIALFNTTSSNGKPVVYVFVTGYTGTELNGSLSKDYYTVGYDEAGNPLWTPNPDPNGPVGRVYDGGGEDVATDLHIDDLGNIFVTGWSMGANGSDFTTIKYDSTGTTEFTLHHDSQIADDKALGVNVDSTGIYVAGSVKLPDETINEKADFFILKYSLTTGEINWIAQYDGTSHLDDVMTDVFFTTSGLVVTGFSQTDTGKVFLTMEFKK